VGLLSGEEAGEGFIIIQVDEHNAGYLTIKCAVFGGVAMTTRINEDDEQNLSRAFDLLVQLPADFLPTGCEQLPLQERDGLKKT
jgi:hypothetical protein